MRWGDCWTTEMCLTPKEGKRQPCFSASSLIRWSLEATTAWPAPQAIAAPIRTEAASTLARACTSIRHAAQAAEQRADPSSGESIDPWPPYTLWSVWWHTSQVYRDAYFCNSMPSSWLNVVCTLPICVTIQLPFLSQNLCRSVRIRGGWNPPMVCLNQVVHSSVTLHTWNASSSSRFGLYRSTGKDTTPVFLHRLNRRVQFRFLFRSCKSCKSRDFDGSDFRFRLIPC